MSKDIQINTLGTRNSEIWYKIDYLFHVHAFEFPSVIINHCGINDIDQI